MEFEKADEVELIYQSSDDDKIFRDENTVFIKFSHKRNGLISSWLNGGYSEDLDAVFNHQISQQAIDEDEDSQLDMGAYLSHLSSLWADRFDLDSFKSSGLITSAKMINTGISALRYRNLEVVSISTAGTNVNAASAGDPASYYEENGDFDLNILDSDDKNQDLSDLSLSNSEDFKRDLSVSNSEDFKRDLSLFNNDNFKSNSRPDLKGTNNSIVLINSKLDESSLVMALMTATEAKTVALRDLKIASRYSDEIATGTGTDGIAVFSNLDSENKLEIAGKHSKLGELIAKTVIYSIKKALARQIWMTPTYQSNALIRLDRYDVDLDKFYNEYLKVACEKEKQEFIKSLVKVNKNPDLVAYVSLALETLDQYRQGLISKKTANVVLDSLLENQFAPKEYEAMKTLVKFIIKEKLD